MYEEKKLLRKKVSKAIKEIPSEYRDNKDRLINDSLLSLTEYQQASVIMAYYPLPDEVDIKPFLGKVLIDKKELILPRIVKDNFEMTVHRVTTLSENLVEGEMSLTEPESSLEEILPENIDLIIVPGRAFTRKGKRLGRGKGYYDRFLTDALNAVLISVCYEEQLFDEIPTEKHDRKIDILVTPHEVITCANT